MFGPLKLRFTGMCGAKKNGLTLVALTRSFEAIKLARLAGIEPTTPWFVAKYSIQLSYSRVRRDYSTTSTCFGSAALPFLHHAFRRRRIFAIPGGAGDLLQRDFGRAVGIQ